MSAEAYGIPTEPAHIEQLQNTAALPATPRRVQDVKHPKSTPNSRGTAVTSEYLRGTTVNALLPSLLEDIRNHRPRDIKDVIKACLMLCKPEEQKGKGPEDLLEECLAAVLPICNGETEDGRKVRSYLEDYATIKSCETDGYKPFALAFNHALKGLETVECDSLRPPADLKIMFHRNDPMPIIGEHNGMSSARKPDTILASFESVKAIYPDERLYDKWEDIALADAGDKPKKNFGWGGALSSGEFRRTRKKGRSTVRAHYGEGDMLVAIPPQPVPGSHVELDEAEADPAGVEGKPIEGETEPTGRSEKVTPLGGQRSAKGSGQGSGKEEVPPSRKSERIVASNKSAPLCVPPLLTAEVGGSSGKRKREAEPQTGSTKRSRGSQGPQETPKIPTRTPAMLQSASYAAARMSHAFWVTHVINLVIVDNVAYVWYYDSQNSVQSCGIDFVQDLPYFLVLLLAFQRFDLQNWGVMKEFKATPDGSITLSPSPEDPELQFTVKRKKIRGHYGLRGRCTQMLETMSSSKDPRNMTETLENVEMVSKFYWPQKSRVAEATILEKAHELGKGDERIGGHLPDMIYTKDFDHYSTMHIRHLLGMEADISGDRVLRWIVFRRLYPITDLIGAEFWKAFWECFRCHLYLWRGGVRHCDISVSNLMYDKRSSRGILNDFDLALLRESPSPTGTERTGTMPFMALDLLVAPDGEVRREYRHDVESFAWVLLWICCTYEDGKEIPDRPLQVFIQPNFQATYEKKLAIKLGKNKDLKPTSSYNQRYFRVALKLIGGYRKRHYMSKVEDSEEDSRNSDSEDPHDSDLEDPRDSDLDRPELVDDELKAIDAELRGCRERLASARLPINLF